MSKPTMNRIFENGRWLWCVEYAGMRRCHEQDWQAQWQYTYCLRLYQSEQAIDASNDAM
jgi:hypothetical protein